MARTPRRIDSCKPTTKVTLQLRGAAVNRIFLAAAMLWRPCFDHPLYSTVSSPVGDSNMCVETCNTRLRRGLQWLPLFACELGAVQLLKEQLHGMYQVIWSSAARSWTQSNVPPVDVQFTYLSKIPSIEPCDAEIINFTSDSYTTSEGICSIPTWQSRNSDHMGM